MNILLADSDLLSRDKTTSLLKQNTDFDIAVFEASDAHSAEMCLKTAAIDVLISDISLDAEADGLSLIEQALKDNPKLSCIAMGTNKNSKTVRQAFICGCSDYIFKSDIKADTLKSALLRTRNTEESSSASAEPSFRFKDNDLTFQSFIADHDISPEQFLGTLSPQLNADNLYVAIFTLDKYIANSQTVSNVFDVYKKTMSIDSKKSVSIFTSDGMFLILYNSPENLMRQQAFDSGQMCRQNIRLHTNCNISYSTKIHCTSPAGLRQQLIDAMTLIELRRYYSEPFSQITPVKLSNEDISKLIYSIKRCLDLRNYDEAINNIRDFVRSAHERIARPKDIKSVTLYVITIFLIHMDPPENGDYYMSEFRKYLNLINAVRTEYEMAACVQHFIDFYMLCRRRVSKVVSPQMKLALDYINTNYMKKITLESVASHVYLNKTYVSQLFKKQLGVSFGDHLENVRIKNAKIMLQNPNMNIAQIAQEVGYTSQSYFTKVFKKNVGVSPLKYKALATSGALPEE